jgi:hypothetical protein
MAWNLPDIKGNNPKSLRDHGRQHARYFGAWEGLIGLRLTVAFLNWRETMPEQHLRTSLG